jgi:hypothetical protein
MNTAMSWPTFSEAIELAKAEIAAGHAINYLVEYSHDRGHFISIQTDQGWNPEPFWQEHEPPRYLGPNDTITDY